MTQTQKNESRSNTVLLLFIFFPSGVLKLIHSANKPTFQKCSLDDRRHINILEDILQ